MTYIAAVEGFPDCHYLRTQLEHGIRNAFTRLKLRLPQHATGEKHPGNSTAMAEMFDFPLTDYQCDRVFDVFRQYAEHLEATRIRVQRQIRDEDRERGQRLDRHIADIRARYEAYSRFIAPAAHPALFTRMEMQLLTRSTTTREYPSTQSTHGL